VTNQMVDSLFDALAESESFPSSSDDDYDFSGFQNSGDSDLTTTNGTKTRGRDQPRVRRRGTKGDSGEEGERTVRAILGTFSTSLSKNRDCQGRRKGGRKVSFEFGR